MNPKSHSTSPARGFTLIELMVSIALVLILILGINQVFKIASDTVNAGQSLSRADRDNRAIQGVLFPDIQNAVVTGAPCFIIRSQYQPAFRNRADEQADRDGNALTVDNDGNNVETDPLDKVPPTAVNARNHRIDELMFFASGLFHRQTGSGAALTSTGAASEAFIWYGHLQLPNNNTAKPFYYNPGNYTANTGSPEGGGGGTGGGATKNDNNKYASQWTLGRVPILLAGDNPGTNITYIKRSNDALSPLAGNSETTDSQRIQWSTCDVAQTSMADYRDALSIYLARNGGTTAQKWYDTIGSVRFWANPIPTRPLTANKVARTAPIFVQGCTQFIVEFAGDFLAQDNNPTIPGTTANNPKYGNILSTVFHSGGSGDGVTDYVLAPGPGGTTVRRTRWYGMPRNVDLTDDLKAKVPTITGGAAGKNPNELLDVVPLRDVVATVGGANTNAIEPDLDRLLPIKPNYAATDAIKAGDRYVAAWGPGDLARGSIRRPTMLRITIVVDDPAGRMSEGQTYEYVFNLP